LADITMPQLGETVTEGTITRWLKQVGDQIAEDDLLFEVSTDKVDSEVPSSSAGYLSEILVAEGETVDVGTKLAVITAEPPGGAGGGEAAAEKAPAAARTDQADGAEPSRDEEPQGGPEAAGAGQAPADDAVEAEAAEAEAAKAAKAAEAEAAEAKAEAAESERKGRPEAAATAPPAATAASKRPSAGGPAGPGGTRPADERPPSGPAAGGPSKVLSPVVRRLIAEYDLDASQIQGTGAGGRITRADVLALIDRQGTTARSGAAPPAPAAPAARAAPAAPAAPAERQAQAPAPVADVTPGERDTVVAFTNIRRRTAEHMVRSKHTSAHTVVAMEVDYSAVDKVREANKQRFKEQEGFSLTYLPFIARALIDAIDEWPNLNSSVGSDELIVHNYVNLGIAVDLNFEGLLVPVIHDADGKRLRALAREIATLAARARSKRLTMDDISGGTITISNAGPFGTLMTVPVINQPQTAILATDGVRKRPVVVESPGGGDAIGIHPVGNLVLSFDHRAYDGAYAAAFMAFLKEILETRDWSSEL
jgi:pyruvate dehydrogenase E2 component (dihydrolipoamide acetyltransferase)